MINKVSIKYLYKHTKRPKDGFSREQLEEVERKCAERFQVAFADGRMVIGSLPDCNPFKRIRLACIEGFVVVDNEVAVVMPSCIIFFNTATGAIKINIKAEGMGIWRRVAGLFSCLRRKSRSSHAG